MSNAPGIGALQSLSHALALTQTKGASSVEEATESPASKQAEKSSGGLPSKGTALVSYNAAGAATSPAASGGLNRFV